MTTPPAALLVPLFDEGGVQRAELVISRLPRHRGDAAVREVVEGGTYRYVVAGEGPVELQPEELFDADDLSLRQGRLLPGEHVGAIRVTVRERLSERLLAGEFAVAPLKLEQVREYRQMLKDISAHATEAILQGFAPPAISLASADAPPELLYQRFAVLEAQLRSEEFLAAVARVLHQPHRDWRPEQLRRPAGAGYAAGSAFARALVGPGQRVPWPGGRALPSLPARLPDTRHEETLDTAPNRFVKYALARWRDLAAELAEKLDTDVTARVPGPVRRGRAALAAAVAQIDEILGADLFREVGQLDAVPTSNQVLLKRSGYREIFRTFALVVSGATIRFDHINDIYTASLRNVATLYEFWCFLALADAVGRVCGSSQSAHAFAPTQDELSLRLRSGTASAIRWSVSRLGRELNVVLYFNRQFSAGAPNGSWTRAMKPDCSLHIQPQSGLPNSASRGDLDVWVHFDAKYRVDGLREELTRDSDAAEDDDQDSAPSFEEWRPRSSRRDDLLKMHAYRDAVHRTAGAYVLFPGDEPIQRGKFTELLPGLGAFPLRPSLLGAGPYGAAAIERFVSDVLDHVSRQASAHERSRYWEARIHRDSGQPAAAHVVHFLDHPPADTDVLLCYVKSPAHHAWIRASMRYNVRADGRTGTVSVGGRELGAPFLLLYAGTSDLATPVLLARAGAWQASDRDDLRALGYPDPVGRLYFVAEIAPISEVPAWLYRANVAPLLAATPSWGAPLAVTWRDVMLAGAEA